jgi:hypothetical protein
MSGHPLQKGRYLYYACNKKGNARHLRDCFEKLVRANEADAIVWGWLEGLLVDEENLERGLKELVKHTDNQLKKARQRLARVSTLLEETERKIKRLASTYASESNDVVANAIKGELKNVGQIQEALQVEHNMLFAQTQQSEITEADQNQIRELAKNVREKLEEPTFEVKRSIMSLLDVKVELVNNGNERWLNCSCNLTLNETSNGKNKPNTNVCGKSSSTMTMLLLTILLSLFLSGFLS